MAIGDIRNVFLLLRICFEYLFGHNYEHQRRPFCFLIDVIKCIRFEDHNSTAMCMLSTCSLGSGCLWPGASTGAHRHIMKPVTHGIPSTMCYNTNPIEVVVFRALRFVGLNLQEKTIPTANTRWSLQTWSSQ